MKESKKGGIAITQIIIIIISIFAFSYILTLQGGFVSAEENYFSGEYDPLAALARQSSTGIPAPNSFGDTGLGEDGQKGDAPKSEKYLSKMLNIDQGTYLDAIATGFQWAGIAYTVVTFIGPKLFGLEDEAVSAASTAAVAGAFAGKGVHTLLSEGGKWESWLKTAPGKDPAWFSKFGAKGFGYTTFFVIGLFVFMNMYSKSTTEIVSFECDPWEAPIGGSNCEKCNKEGILSCSEYQCRSLGQACQLLNQGTDEETCEWVNKNDVSYPIIQPWENALLEDHEYNPEVVISPPDRGVQIARSDSTSGCIKAFTPLTFGVILDEPAKCKVDYERKSNFEEMSHYFGGSPLFRYNHTQLMSLPGASALEAEGIVLENDGDYSIYTRCQDANGNHNTATFVFQFCVEEGPDTTPPLIVSTNVLNNMPVRYNQTSMDLEVYVNEPANCKWSKTDQIYKDMEETMSCSSSVLEMNAQMLYKCSTTLTGLQNNKDNKFYFRCEDQPLVVENDRNINVESHEFVVVGTQPLVITSVEPEDGSVAKEASEPVKVTLEAETSAGYNEGISNCYSSPTGEDDSYVLFRNTDSYQHSQELWLPEGSYTYYIKCLDLGGNDDIEIINFEVESDGTSPIVVRAFHEETYLRIITDEKAECVYDTVDCNYLFDDGIGMSEIDDVNHFTDWKTDIDFYIRCKDEFGNEPAPNACSIIARPFDIF